jgi:hypothetical protein
MRSVSAREHDVRGIARVEEEGLVLEWSGVTKVSEVDGFATNVTSEPYPGGRRVVPLDAIRSVQRRGWWWRPRVELQVRELSLFDGVPGAAGSAVALGVARDDIGTAGRFVVQLRAACRSVSGVALSGPS